VAAAVGFAAWSLLLGEGGLLPLQRLRRENAKLAGEITRLRQEQIALRLQLAELESPGSFALEKVARERYGMHRENERVLHVLGTEAAPAP
jgi:cell division protein FtsB